MNERHYLCIDLKSFFASVECVERGLDPMTTKLVVADPDRSKNTICLAVTPTMKRLGVKNRCRMRDIPPNLEYIVAQPRMQRYIDYAARIYGIYLSYVAKEDIHVYSIDEAFLDVTDYLELYSCSPRELGARIMQTVLDTTGIRATCGVGTNLYLTKVALDITAKHSPDFIGELTEESYRATLWDHRPLTDFWRIGRGIAAKLANYGINTMRDIAHTDENFLYKLFGIDAELLIDHAWGREPVTIADIHNYRPRSRCLSNGQVLMSDYPYEKGHLIVREMMDVLCLDMLKKDVVTDTVSLYIGYSGSSFFSHGHLWTFHKPEVTPAVPDFDIQSHGMQSRITPSHSLQPCNIPSRSIHPHDMLPHDMHPRDMHPRDMQSHPPLPDYVHGTTSLISTTNSAADWLPAISALYRRIVDPARTIRRVVITCNNIVHEEYHQLDIFSFSPESEKNKRIQTAMLEIQSRFGKDALIRGMNLEEGAMTLTRNHQIGGHKSGE